MSLRTTLVPALALAAVAAGCNFDAAYARYCEGNAACEAGGGSGGGGSGGTGGTGGTGEGGSGGSTLAPPETCLFANDCRTGETCLPKAHVCAKLCETPADCPEGLDACVPLEASHGWPMPERVCACSGAAACASIPSSTCSFVDHLCEPLCANDDDCATFSPDRVCDFSGVCVIEPNACVSNSDCADPFQPRCDTRTNRCTGCLSNDDCRGRPDGRSACDSRGACVFPRP